MSTEKQKIVDHFQSTELEDILLAQLRKLAEPTCDTEKEIKRTQAIVSAGTVLINSAKVKIDTVRVLTLMGAKKNAELPAAGKVKQLNDGITRKTGNA